MSTDIDLPITFLPSEAQVFFWFWLARQMWQTFLVSQPPPLSSSGFQLAKVKWVNKTSPKERKNCQDISEIYFKNFKKQGLNGKVA